MSVSVEHLGPMVRLESKINVHLEWRANVRRELTCMPFVARFLTSCRAFLYRVAPGWTRTMLLAVLPLLAALVTPSASTGNFDIPYLNYCAISRCIAKLTVDNAHRLQCGARHGGQLDRARAPARVHGDDAARARDGAAEAPQAHAGEPHSPREPVQPHG